jgi:2-dehydro-3-deoxyglucarate aldolase/4-hydroxy-2-oxoheptanedioate aldolase
MNVSAIQRLRRKLAEDQPVYGLWVTLDAVGVSEIAVACGLDWIVIDAEHGLLDWGDIAGHLRSAARSTTVALVRLAAADRGLIKRALDLGADGVVLPWIETDDQLREAVADALYPPDGRRGMGAERATGWGRAITQHATQANEHVLIVPIIETVTAGRNIEALCDVPGVELFQVGPADYSATAGYPGEWEGPGVAEDLLAVLDTLRRRGKHCGVLARNPADLDMRREQGFRFLGLGMDAGLLIRGLEEMLRPAGRIVRITADLEPPREEGAAGGSGP